MALVKPTVGQTAWGTVLNTALDYLDTTKAPIASPTFTGTVSGITKTMIGLSNVDDTSDVNKPVSTAQQAALDLKANLASPTPTTYSPVFSSAGGSTQIAFTGTPATGSYMKQGKLVHFRLKVLYTTVTSFGSGAGLQYYVTLPFAPAADYVFRDALYVKGSNGNQYELSAHATTSSTTMSLWHSAGSGNELTMNQSTPQAAAVADYFYLSGTYESV